MEIYSSRILKMSGRILTFLHISLRMLAVSKKIKDRWCYGKKFIDLNMKKLARKECHQPNQNCVLVKMKTYFA